MSKLGQKALSLGERVDAVVNDMQSTGILYGEAVREFKKRFILTALKANQGNQVRAARELGMHRNTLSRTIADLKIDLKEFRRAWHKPMGPAVAVVNSTTQTVTA